NNKAAAVAALGNHPAAVVYYDQAIAILESLVKRDDRHELTGNLATAIKNRAAALEASTDHQGGFPSAAASGEFLESQAAAYINEASGIGSSRDAREALALYDQAIAILERLVEQRGRHETAKLLAVAYERKSIRAHQSDD